MLIGNVGQWPPDTFESRKVWDQRESAVGASIPTRAGQDDDRNLVLHLLLDRPREQTASFDGVALTYVAEGTKYTRRTHFTFVVRDHC